MHVQKLLATMALFAIGAYTLPHGAHNARNFENALDKLENLDQMVDPPKETGPVEGGHHAGGPPVKRAEADQGYEGFVQKRNFENALDKLENLDQVVDPPKEPGPVEGGHHVGGPPVKRAEADQGYEGFVQKRNFENALDKLENLDQAVDPPKEPGPVEGEGHHVGGPPVKRAEADQGYEGYGA